VARVRIQRVRELGEGDTEADRLKESLPHSGTEVGHHVDHRAVVAVEELDGEVAVHPFARPAGQS